MVNGVANLLTGLPLARQSIRTKGLPSDRWRARSTGPAAPLVAAAQRPAAVRGNVVGRYQDRFVAKRSLSRDTKPIPSIAENLRTAPGMREWALLLRRTSKPGRPLGLIRSPTHVDARASGICKQTEASNSSEPHVRRKRARILPSVVTQTLTIQCLKTLQSLNDCFLTEEILIARRVRDQQEGRSPLHEGAI